MKMDNFCIITNRDKDKSLETTKLVQEYLLGKGKQCRLKEEAYCLDGKEFVMDTAWIDKSTDCVIVLGGDGTIIRAATDLYEKEIPLLGINLGTLGFLTEIEKQDIIPALTALLNNQYLVKERMMVETSIKRNEQVVYFDHALNDVVIGRNGFSRIISMSVYVNGILVDTYRGDGVIIATPTGSTGYSMSAGGPIAAPDSNVIIITPICSHSMSSRSILVSAEDEVTVTIDKSKKSQKEEAIATVDGRMAMQLNTGDSICVRKADRIAKLIKINQKNFYELLRNKLK